MKGQKRFDFLTQPLKTQNSLFHNQNENVLENIEATIERKHDVGVSLK